MTKNTRGVTISSFHLEIEREEKIPFQFRVNKKRKKKKGERTNSNYRCAIIFRSFLATPDIYIKIRWIHLWSRSKFRFKVGRRRKIGVVPRMAVVDRVSRSAEQRRRFWSAGSRREETRVPFTGSTETALYVANAARWWSPTTPPLSTTAVIAISINPTTTTTTTRGYVTPSFTSAPERV